MVVGARQAVILNFLIGGPHSVAALINRTDPTQPEHVLASIRALARRGLIEVHGKPTANPRQAPWVALTPLANDEEARPL
jgi:hypothetical protein